MLKKILPAAGVNRENTRYTNEGRWYDCDKIRFRYGTPEKIGGWQAVSSSYYLGAARSLWPWSSLNAENYLGVGTNLKYYVNASGTYNDITPIVTTTSAGTITFSAVTVAPFSSTVTVNHVAHGITVGTSVTFSGVDANGLGVGGNITQAVLEQEYQVNTIVNANSYTIIAKDPSTGAAVTSNAFDSGNGGAAVVGAYQVNAGNEIAETLSGWGAGTWGSGTWGIGTTGGGLLFPRVWNHQNFGEDLIFGPQGGPLYYWDESAGVGTRGVALSSLSGASNVPSSHNLLLVSDASRFVMAFGCPELGSSVLDPMLIRWSEQESAVNWTPAVTNQAGSLRLSHGSRISAVAQVRQEILVWTDTSVYSLQYLGPPIVWGSQLLADNVSIVSDRAAVNAAGVTYWMGDSKFYVYDGRVNALPCDIRQYIFNDFNFQQASQVFAATNQQFSEIWWFYCSANSNEIDSYAIFNYMERIWYYGKMGRTAWIDSSILSDYPIAATYANNLVYHEIGNDDLTTSSPQPIAAYITSSEFDIEDGDRFGFVWRVLPDITFRGSSANSPTATLTLLPLQNSGSGYNSPQSLGGSSNGVIARGVTTPIEQFTQQINIRVRGRQMSMKLESTGLGVQWQCGSMRIDIRQSGRKS